MAPEVGASETAFGSSIVTAANKESENVMRNIISINNKNKNYEKRISKSLG
jgi:hypothetical protein